MPPLSSPNKPLPTRDAELKLHTRLLSGDHTAPADVADVLFEPLVRWLESRNPKVDPQLCGDAASMAFFELVKNPGLYKPNHQKAIGLFAFLRMSASGDLKNLMRREKNNRQDLISLESVEEMSNRGKYGRSREEAPVQLQIQEDVQFAMSAVIPVVRDGLAAKELKALDLLLEGEKKTIAFVEVLEIGHLSAAQQALEVKRLKDKLNRRIERARAEYER